MNKPRTFFLAGLILLIAWLCWVWYVDPFMVMAGMILGLYGGVPTLILAVVLKFRPRGIGKTWSDVRPAIFVALGIALLSVAAVPINRVLFEHAVADAKSYPEKIADRLEQHLKTHGTYPSSLAEIKDLPRPPRLLPPARYRSEGTTYSFWFPVPGGLIDTWHYDSRTGRWTLST
jgi:hypothetical protein